MTVGVSFLPQRAPWQLHLELISRSVTVDMSMMLKRSGIISKAGTTIPPPADLSASDIYNFDELRTVLYGITFANAANDLGWAMQRIGMLVIYSFSVSFFWGDI